MSSVADGDLARLPQRPKRNLFLCPGTAHCVRAYWKDWSSFRRSLLKLRSSG